MYFAARELPLTHGVRKSPLSSSSQSLRARLDTLPRIVSRPMLSGKLTTLVPQLVELHLDV